MKLNRNLVDYVQRFRMPRLEIDLVTRGRLEIEDGYYNTSEGPQDEEYRGATQPKEASNLMRDELLVKMYYKLNP